MEIHANGCLRGLDLAERDVAGFDERTKLAAETILHSAKNEPQILLVSHYDADGLSSAAIMASAIMRLKLPYQLRIVRELDELIASELQSVRCDLLLFADIGSGYLDTVSSIAKERVCLVLDHHPPSGKPTDRVVQVNPHDFGIDGARDISSAGVTYFVAKSLSSDNVDLSEMAVVGALGDMQDKNAKRALAGLNERIVTDASNAGRVTVEKDLVLFGRETRPIHRALAYTTTPYLANLSGQEETCYQLLIRAGIPLKEGERWRTLADLSQTEKQNLLNAVIEFLSSQKVAAGTVMELIGYVYTILREPQNTPTRDGREYAALLNACGRMGHPGLGVSVGMGDRASGLLEAQELVVRYRSTLADYMKWLTESPSAIQELKVACIIRGENKISENMTGAFSSILSSSGSLRPDKVTIVAAAASKGGIKLSARVPEQLLKKGVNAGVALDKASRMFGGFGGGHDVAAGAYVPNSEVAESFLAKVDELLAEQASS